MKDYELHFISKILEINKNKECNSLSEELKEMYRRSIKNGVRKKFIDQVKKMLKLIEI